MHGTWVRSLGWDNPLQKGMATHYSILAWRIPWTEDPGELQSMGLQRVRQDWMTKSGDGQLTMLWWFQVNSEGTQPYIYVYSFSPKLLSHPGFLFLTLHHNQQCFCKMRLMLPGSVLTSVKCAPEAKVLGHQGFSHLEIKFFGFTHATSSLRCKLTRLAGSFLPYCVPCLQPLSGPFPLNRHVICVKPERSFPLKSPHQLRRNSGH